MSSELLSYELQDAVATISMDDGKANALSIAMLEGLHEALDRAEEEGAVILLTGREGRFSAGFDLNVFRDTPELLPKMLRLGGTLSERLLRFPKPVIVACSGHAIAAGSFPLLAADFRVGVAGDFQIGLNEVQIGLTVPLFAQELARQRLHPAAFSRAVVNAHMHDPQEALAAGFLDQVVSAEELGEVARNAADRHAGLNLDAHAATKLRAREAALEAIRDGIEAEFPASTAN